MTTTTTIDYIQVKHLSGVRIYAVVAERQVGRIEVLPPELRYGRPRPIDYAEITVLHVDSEYRRRGIGHELVTRGLDWAAERGYGRVAVQAPARPESPGRALYEAMGFVPRSIVLDVELAKVTL